ncbi:NADPH-dependent FMN reductase [Pseudomonas sp. F8002]|uniref:NADPH-dependent FMN reductase n=1 Tax=Pseudomonas sp. F8002 TaxID=2738822 RepID=UPI0015A00DAE|nr:NAD(P)H-dependent oxidoreductase [Pseudomonas sp. F8002]NWB53340.1 NAD(P)H-dependent oxidoreductase [Pseudomonas sp. F8002]
MREIKLLALCGSLRQGSNHATILRTIGTELLPPQVSLRTHSLHDIPLYDRDLDEGDLPTSVRDLRQAITEADGVLIATPEISYGMSGVIKNALDWLSSHPSLHPFKGKPVMTLTGSPTFTGGARAQLQLSESLWAIEATPVAYPQIVITNTDSKIFEGRLADEATRQFLAEGMLAMEEMIRLEDLSKLPFAWA